MNGVREDTGYCGDQGRPRIQPAKIHVEYIMGIDKGIIRWIRADIARQMIMDGICREVSERQPGEEG